MLLFVSGFAVDPSSYEGASGEERFVFFDNKLICCQQHRIGCRINDFENMILFFLYCVQVVFKLLRFLLLHNVIYQKIASLKRALRHYILNRAG